VLRGHSLSQTQEIGISPIRAIASARSLTDASEGQCVTGRQGNAGISGSVHIGADEAVALVSRAWLRHGPKGIDRAGG
jgi:hypothetical protein